MTKIQLQSDTCSRCGGTGDYPSACWSGVCLGCSGKGTVLTAKGKAASRKMLAWQDANMTVTVDQLRSDDLVYMTSAGGKQYVARVVEITDATGSLRYVVDGETTTPEQRRVRFADGTGLVASPGSTLKRVWTAETIRRCYTEALARMSGAELVD